MKLPSIKDIEREQFYRKFENHSVVGIPAQKFMFTGMGFSEKPQCEPVRISIIPKLRPFFDGAQTRGAEYFVLKGGRGSGKSESIGELLVLIARSESTRILCTREIQNTIADSVKKVIEDWIDFLGFRDEFHITDKTIVHKKTKTDFIFVGLQAGTKEDSIKSLKGVKYVWIEEAQTLSLESWEKLNPTIRIDGRRIFISYNPRTLLDTVLEIEKKNKAITIHVNYNENSFLPQTSIDDALELKQTDFDRYLHIWEGVPMADDATSIILPYSWLKRCVDLHKEFGGHEGRRFAGFDIADGVTTKHDKNSITIRSGPAVLYNERWQVGEIYQSVQKVHQRYFQWGFDSVAFDATALGLAAKSEYARLRNEEKKDIPYETYPFLGGSSPEGKDIIFTKHGKKIIRNRDYFKNLKAQSYWNLRLRLENSMKLLQGKDLDRPEYYLSFSSDIKELDHMFSELSQATYSSDTSGRIIIDKCPGIKEIKVEGKTKKIRSPNDADSCGYSFADDFIGKGLRSEGVEVVVESKPEEHHQTITSWEAF